MRLEDGGNLGFASQTFGNGPDFGSFCHTFLRVVCWADDGCDTAASHAGIQGRDMLLGQKRADDAAEARRDGGWRRLVVRVCATRRR